MLFWRRWKNLELRLEVFTDVMFDLCQGWLPFYYSVFADWQLPDPSQQEVTSTVASVSPGKTIKCLCIISSGFSPLWPIFAIIQVVFDFWLYARRFIYPTIPRIRGANPDNLIVNSLVCRILANARKFCRINVSKVGTLFCGKSWQVYRMMFIMRQLNLQRRWSGRVDCGRTVQRVGDRRSPEVGWPTRGKQSNGPVSWVFKGLGWVGISGSPRYRRLGYRFWSVSEEMKGFGFSN